MDGFGDNFDQAEVDPAAEFLAREQDQLAGLEDDLNTIGTAPASGDAFSLQGSQNANASPQDAPAQLNHTGSFEMIDNFGQQDGFDTGSEAAVPSEQAADSNDNAVEQESKPVEAPKPFSSPAQKPMREEPEKIRKWREEQKACLEEKDAAEEKKKEEWMEIAKKELEEWYKHHEDQIAKTKAANRSAEKLFVAECDEIEPGTEWERIAKLCDFNPKSSKASKDVSRMRSIILQLKQSPPNLKKV